MTDLATPSAAKSPRPGKLTGMDEGLRRGVRLMTPLERRTAAVLLLTALVNGLLQTGSIIAIVSLMQWTMDPASKQPVWLVDAFAAVFGPGGRRDLLLQVAGVVALLIVAKTGFGWAQGGWMATFSAGCERRLSGYMMKRILVTSYAWLVRQNSARLRQLLFGFVSVWSRDFIRTLMRLVNDLIMAAFLIALLVISQPVAGVAVGCVVALLAAGVFSIVRPRLVRLAIAKRRGILGATSVSTEAILGVKEVKMAGAEDRFAELFDEQVGIYSDADAEAQQWTQIPRHFLELLAYGSLVAVAAYVTLYDAVGTDLAGILLLYGFAGLRLLPVFSTGVSGLTTLIGAFPVIRDLEELIVSTTETEPPPAGITIAPWREVRLNNVTYRYQGSDRAALNEVSLTIERGKAYGVVGPSGAGKSTMIDLVAGLLAPTTGQVLIDGVPLSPEHRRAWRRRFGYVAQRTFLLDTTLRRNITFNTDDTADEARLAEAIAFARLEGVVARLPGGIDGQLGEQGAFLSGGERQRVAIARALYRGANLLILDEATSSLDTLVEHEIAESIQALRGKVATILVSHRLGLVRYCDELWLFDRARLAGRGPHAELLAASALYRQMVAPGGEEVAA